jgi:hypothetical protein
VSSKENQELTRREPMGATVGECFRPQKIPHAPCYCQNRRTAFGKIAELRFFQPHAHGIFCLMIL